MQNYYKSLHVIRVNTLHCKHKKARNLFRSRASIKFFIFYTLASDRHPNSGGGGNKNNVAVVYFHESKMP